MSSTRTQTVPVGSRWQNNLDAGYVIRILERRPFGLLSFRKESRAILGDVKQRDLLSGFTRLPDAPAASLNVAS